MIRKLFSIIALMTLVVSASAQSNESAHSLRIYSHSGMTKLVMKPGWTVAHSRNDVMGAVHNDCVSLVISDGDSTVLTRPIADIDSIVMPGRRTVVFHGGTVETPALAKAITTDRVLDDARQSDSIPPCLRSSFSGNFPGKGSGNVTFYWTENDRIQLETGDFSHAVNLSADKTKASFVFDGADLDADTYGVYYPDKTVHISNIQTQTGADNSDHIGAAGDCGYAEATQNGDGSYSFTLKHKVAYFCFLPHIDYMPSVKITKIVVHASSAITGDYQLSASGIYNGTNTSQDITLNLIPKASSDFFIGHTTTTEQDSCASYMVFVPQNTSYTVTYFLTDTLSRLSTTYYQTFSLNAQPNTVYPVTCNIPESVFEYIDLGVGALWNTRNEGANVANNVGTLRNYETAVGEASQNEDNKLPNEEEINDLINKCSWEHGTFNGEEGWMVSGYQKAVNNEKPFRLFLPYQTYWISSDKTTNKHKALLVNKNEHKIIDVDKTKSIAIRKITSVTIPTQYRIPKNGTSTLDFSHLIDGYNISIYDHAGPDSSYENGCDGSLIIKCLPGYVINIVGQVKTENSFDYLTVYDNVNGIEKVLIQATGSQTFNLKSTSNIVRLYFHSDGSNVNSGVKLVVSSLFESFIHNINVIKKDGGNIAIVKSTALPNDTVKITASPNEGYILDHINVKADSTVMTSYYDNPETTATVTLHFQECDTVRVIDANCYNDHSWFLMPYGNVTIEPIWKKIEEKASYDINMPEIGTKTVETVALKRIIDSGKVIHIYDHAGPDKDYSNNINDYLIIKGIDGYSINLSGTLNTENGFDYLCIYKTQENKDTEIERFSGDGKSVNISCNSSDIKMYFHSDGSAVRSGFDLILKIKKE